MNELFQKLSDAVFLMEEEAASAVAKEIIQKGLDAASAIEQGVTDGMVRAGELYDKEEYFVSELLLCADAMKAALDVLKPHLAEDKIPSKGKIVIGTVEGDTHDIGKNIVSVMLEGGGFTIYDLGRDVSAECFVDCAVAYEADIIAISSLMTSTMDNMKDTIELLKIRGLREKFAVIVGGRPLSQAFAEKIGADGYAESAAGAYRLCLDIMGKRSIQVKN